MNSKVSLLFLLLCSCSTAEQVDSRTSHGGYVAIHYSWRDLWGPCPKRHDETRLYSPDGDLLVCQMRGLSDSPDGRWTVAQSNEPGYWLFLIDHRKGELVKIKDKENLHSLGIWSPRGSRLLLQHDSVRENKSGPVVLDLETGQPQFMTLFLRPWGHSEQDICWSPDGRSIAYIDRSSRDSTFDLVQFQVLPTPAELQRVPLEKVDRYWLRYQIAWKEGRAVPVPRS